MRRAGWIELGCREHKRKECSNIDFSGDRARSGFLIAGQHHNRPDSLLVQERDGVRGNFPFLIEEVAHLIGIKVVYLTDDPIRFKRKWKRDIDYRKKYEPTYFRNRYFKDQFIMAEIAYRPQMAMCDMVVDTTGAALWTTPEVAAILEA